MKKRKKNLTKLKISSTFISLEKERTGVFFFFICMDERKKEKEYFVKLFSAQNALILDLSLYDCIPRSLQFLQS